MELEKIWWRFMVALLLGLYCLFLVALVVVPTVGTAYLVGYLFSRFFCGGSIFFTLFITIALSISIFYFVYLKARDFIRGTERLTRGGCLNCGYDKQNLPRCPECGCNWAD